MTEASTHMSAICAKNFRPMANRQSKFATSAARGTCCCATGRCAYEITFFTHFHIVLACTCDHHCQHYWRNHFRRMEQTYDTQRDRFQGARKGCDGRPSQWRRGRTDVMAEADT